MAEDEDYEEVFPCSICGRNFIQSSLVKHIPACQKLQKMHRKVFDSGKQRALNSDIPLNDIRKAQKEKDKNGGFFPRPKTHWRERHDEFISAISSSKNVKETRKIGAPLPPPPRTSMPSDYIHCNYCNRSFNARAAERHISYCKEQYSRKSTAASNSSRITRRSQSSTSRGSTSSSKQSELPPTSSGISKENRYGLKKPLSLSSSFHEKEQTVVSTKANRPPSRRSSREQQRKPKPFDEIRHRSKSREFKISADSDIGPLSASSRQLDSTALSKSTNSSARSTSRSRWKAPKPTRNINH